MSIIAFLQSLDLIKWLVALAGVLGLAFGGTKLLKNAGAKEQRLKDIENKQKQDAATQKKVDIINEKISTDPDAIREWLRRKGHLRK